MKYACPYCGFSYSGCEPGHCPNTVRPRRMTQKRWLNAWGSLGMTIAARNPDGSFRAVRS